MSEHSGPRPESGTPGGETPTRIGPYRIVDVLGRGGQSVVYRARHRSTGTNVALKALLVSDRLLFWSIRREIQTLQRLRHPNVVQILDLGLEEGRPWYAMELIDGPDLTSYCRPGRSVLDGEPFEADALPRLLSAAQQVCSALAYLHGEGIVHRDLKPSNILIANGVGDSVETDGSNGAGLSMGRAVLVDFGLTQQFAKALGREQLSDLDRAGTAAFMPPEQLRGELVDARADLFALGCIIYMEISGRRPFANADETLDPSVRPARLSSLADGIPAALDDLVDGLLARDLRRRIGDANIVAAALRRLLPSSALPVAAPSPPAKPVLFRPRFVGRERLATRLTREILSGFESRRGGLTLVEGEHGVGKTRLVIEVARQLEDRDVLVLPGQGTSSSLGGRPFHPLRELFGVLVDHCRKYGEEETEILLGGDRGAILAPYVPALAGLVDLVGRDPLAGLSEDEARAELLLAAFRTIRAMSDVRPLLIAIDDVHWSDELTLQLLSFALESGRLANAPIAVIGTFRRDESGEQLTRITLHPDVRLVALDRFDEADVEALIGEVLGGTPPAGLARRLASESEGNPLFVIEYLRAAVSLGLLTRDLSAPHSPWVLRAGARRESAADQARSVARAVGLPRSLQGLIERRLDRLPDTAQRTVETASVLGREVDSQLLLEVCDLPEEQLNQAAQLLVRSAILTDFAPGLLRFDHHKIQTVAYQRIRPLIRAQLHRRAAEALERQSRDERDRPLPTLAWHWREAGETARARDYYLTAARRARRRHAIARAEGFYRAYLELADEPTAERAAVHSELARDVYLVQGRSDEAWSHFGRALAEAQLVGDEGRAADSLDGLGRVHMRRGELDDAERSWKRGLSIERRLGRPRRQAQLLLQLARLYHQKGDMGRAWATTQAAQRLLAQARHPSDEADARLNLAMIAESQEDWPSVIRHLEEALVGYHTLGNRIRESRALILLGNALWHQDRLDDAARRYRAALTLSRELGQRPTEAMALGNLGNIARTQGRFREATEYFEASLELNRRVGSRRNEAIALVQLAATHHRRGMLGAAAYGLERAVTIHERSQSLAHAHRTRIGLADVLVDQGYLDDAERLLEQSLVGLTQLGSERWRSITLAVLARLELARLALAPAQARIDEALRIRDRLKPTMASQTLVTAGRIYLAQGKIELARAALEDAESSAIPVQAPFETSFARLYLARLHRFRGETSKALSCVESAEKTFRELDARLGLALALCELGHLALADGVPPPPETAKAAELVESEQMTPQSELARAVAQLEHAIRAFEAGRRVG